MNNTATNTATCPTVRKQIGKTTYINQLPDYAYLCKDLLNGKM